MVLVMIGFRASETGRQFSLRYKFVESSARRKTKSENMKQQIRRRWEHEQDEEIFSDRDEHFIFSLCKNENVSFLTIDLRFKVVGGNHHVMLYDLRRF